MRGSIWHNVLGEAVEEIQMGALGKSRGPQARAMRDQDQVWPRNQMRAMLSWWSLGSSCSI